jgi:hypothetical protein
MSAQFNVEKPADVRITLTITLDLASWREIARRLGGTEPERPVGYPLIRVIDDMTSQVTQTFWPSAKVFEKGTNHE